MIRLVMYDLDGTLLDTAGEIAAAVNLALAEFGGTAVDEARVRTWIGHGAARLIEEAWRASATPETLAPIAPLEEVRAGFMRHYRKRPVQLANMLDYGLNEQKLFAVSNTRLANSCSDCGACRQNCPIRIDTGYQISLARQQMFARGAIPPAYHDYLLRDMAHAHSPAAFLFLAAPSGHNRYLFFPGCQMGASDPQYVKKRL